jgi:hypothetical protein
MFIRLFRRRRAGLLAWPRNAEILADPIRHGLDDLAMPRDRTRLATRRIEVDRMAPSFTKELAAVGREVTNQVDALHSTGTASGSRRTSCPSDSCLASSRLA